MRAKVKKNRKAEKSALGSYRIIGGEWRGRRLAFPEVQGLRPTTDRVRETVFNWLTAHVAGARVLDMFAGSGALGFEALSRGAKTLTATELEPRAVELLKENSRTLGAQAAVECCDALSWAQNTVEHYDLVFIDPPFRLGLVEQALASLAAGTALAPDALVYIEQEKEAPAPQVPGHWRMLKEKVAGQLSYRLYRTGANE